MAFSDSFPGFRLRLTSWGGLFLFLSFLTAIAAVNTGNSMLAAVLGLSLASFAVSGLWSRQALAGLHADLSWPAEVFAGRPTLVTLRLTNRSRLFPAFGVVLRDGSGHVLHVEGMIAAKGSQGRTVAVTLPQRGWFDLSTWRAEVLLPLGFFAKSKLVLVNRRVLVLPRILDRVRRDTHYGGESRSLDTTSARGREGDVTQLREFHEGDDQRQIHWKQSARQQRLISVERQRSDSAPLFYTVDPRVHDPTNPRVRQAFERMISEVATAIVHRLEDGLAVGLVVGSVVVAPVHDRSRLGALLRPLAEVEARPLDDRPPPVVTRPGHGRARGGLS
jgi:uncharacterized protein (DUF58 family)